MFSKYVGKTDSWNNEFHYVCMCVSMCLSLLNQVLTQTFAVRWHIALPPPSCTSTNTETADNPTGQIGKHTQR